MDADLSRNSICGMNLGVKRRNYGLWLVACSFWLLISASSPLTQQPICSEQDVKTLTSQLLRDLPGYANRASQRARRLNRTNEVYSYVVVAGRPEFAPLTLGPGARTSADPPAASEPVEQVFFTTLERQYTGGKAVELQQFHWVFLTKTKSGWRLAMMFSQTGTYPAAKRPPTAPRDSSNGTIGQAINAWLRDCQARSVRNRSRNSKV